MPIPRGKVVSDVPKATVLLPCVVKSQVPVGGRGKAGGIRVVQTSEELQKTVDELLALPVHGYIPQKLLLEEVVDIAQEYYVSLSVDRSKAAIRLMAHRYGGIDVENHTPDDFFTTTISRESVTTVGDALADYLNLPKKSFLLQDILERLYRCFTKNDATLLEINPLILTTSGTLVAGDCKMTVDDDAAFRHPEWEFEDKPANTSFVVLNPNGTVATIANGAGLAMATVDAVKAADLTPANFLDIGGGATVEGIVRSFQAIMDFPSIRAIIINIFGGIVRCDDVAKAILAARQQFPNLPPLYIRLSGTNSDQAAALLQKHDLVLYSDLAACIKGICHG